MNRESDEVMSLQINDKDLGKAGVQFKCDNETEQGFNEKSRPGFVEQSEMFDRHCSTNVDLVIKIFMCQNI